MNIFVLLTVVIGLVVAAVVLMLLVAVAATLLARGRKWGRKKSLKIAAVAGAVILVFPLGYMLLVHWVWGPRDATSPADLQALYKSEFRSLPPPGVTVLKGRT